MRNAAGGGLRPNGGTALLDKHVEKMLSEPWGAAKAGLHYNKEVLGSLCEQFSRLEPQARRGALQGTLFMRQGQRHGLEAEVRNLLDLGSGDKDQWVNLIARALGGLTERFDLQQLQQDVPAVADALSSIRDKIQVEGTPDTFRPLEEMYLSPRLLAAAGAPPREGPSKHGHFTLRARKETKKKFAGSATASAGGLKTAAHTSVGSIPNMLTGGDSSFRASARSGLMSSGAAAGGVHRRPAPPSAVNSMFAPPSRKPSSSGMAFFRDSGPTKRVGPGGGISSRSFLAGRNKKEGSNKTMMIDVSEAAQLGTVKGEDLQKEQRERDKQREQQERELKRKQEHEEKQRRIQKMMEEREQKKKLETERKRAREEDAAKRKADSTAKRLRTEAPEPGREGVATPSPQEEPIHGF